MLNKDYIQSTESRSKSQGVKAQKLRSKSQGVGVQKSRSRSQEILDFCKTPRTLSEIAKELNLSDRYNMKRRYIDPLLEGGSLSMLEANKTAPTQKYTQSRGRWTSYELNKDYIQSTESRSKSQGVKAQKLRSKSQGVGVQKSRSRSQEILDFCKTPRTLSEIAKELNLSDRYNMKRRYIDPLLEGGSLSMLEANKTAPTQKYIAVRVTISKE